MGSIIQASCKCGFQKEMYLGGGMENFTTHCSFPYYCQDCGKLFEGNMLDKNVKCEECESENVLPYNNERVCKSKGGEVFSWYVDELGDDIILPYGDYLCPACGNYSMTFSPYGCWD